MENKHCFTLIYLLSVLFIVPIAGDADYYENQEQKIELPTKCGSFSSSLEFKMDLDRISSGYDARQGQFPSYVQLHCPRSGNKVSRCGGTLISDRHILTAAHCLNGTVDDEPIKIGLGIGGVKGSDRLYTSEQTCVSPKYSHPHHQTRQRPHTIYDLGIIKVSERIKFDSLVQPVCLPLYPLEEEKQAYVIGLGGIGQDPETNKLVRPTRLRVLPVARVECDQMNSHEAVLCTKYSDHTYRGMICHGDSGGPLVSLDSNGRQTIYGISSYGLNKCVPMDGVPNAKRASGYFVNVHNIWSEVDRLLEECA